MLGAGASATAGAVWVGAGAVWAGAVGTGVGAVGAGVAGVGAGAGGVGSALGAGSSVGGAGCGSTGTGFSGYRGGGGGRREVVPGIVGMLGGRRLGDVATAVVLDARVVLDHARRRLGLRDDGRDVLARAGVGPGLLLGEVGGAVAVGVVLGVVDAVAVGVGLPRVRGRRELDAVAQAVAV